MIPIKQPFFGTFFHEVWNNFWLKGATPLKIDQKTSQTITKKSEKLKVAAPTEKNPKNKKLKGERREGLGFDPVQYQINLNK